MTYLANVMLAVHRFILGSIFEGFYCNPASFVENLKYMGIGMLAIFIVIGVIVGMTYLLNALFQDRSK